MEQLANSFSLERESLVWVRLGREGALRSDSANVCGTTTP